MTEAERIAAGLSEAQIMVGSALYPQRLFAAHEQQALRNHSQTISRLAARGGISWHEARCILGGIYWADQKPQSDDEAAVRKVLEQS